MKYIIIIFINLIFIIQVNSQEHINSGSLNSSSYRLQDNKIDLFINGQLSHFIAKGKQPNNNFFNKFYIPINPGIELIFDLKIGNGLSALSGAGYSWGMFFSSSIENGPRYKVRFEEFNIPVLFRRDIKQNKFITLGLYPGWKKNGHLQNLKMGDDEWYNISNKSDLYNNKKFTLDLYFDIGKQESLSIFKSQDLLISLFIKYKLEDYWIEKFRSKINYGVKISYSLISL